MKEILYNNDNLKEEEINNIVRRAKAIIINSNDEILFAHTQDNYFFVGGRLEPNETFEEGIVREIKEETGRIAYEPRGRAGRWHDLFYIPDGEEMTLAELREIDYKKEASYWGDAKDQFAIWYVEKYKDELN